jgi:hypothetical protein
LPLTFAILGGIAVLATFAALRVWPADDPDEIEHVHDALDRNHPHVAGAAPVRGGYRHRHAFVIDSEHPWWPR